MKIQIKTGVIIKIAKEYERTLIQGGSISDTLTLEGLGYCSECGLRERPELPIHKHNHEGTPVEEELSPIAKMVITHIGKTGESGDLVTELEKYFYKDKPQPIEEMDNGEQNIFLINKHINLLTRAVNEMRK